MLTDYLIACDTDTRAVACHEHVRRFRLNNTITAPAAKLLRAGCGSAPAMAVYHALRGHHAVAREAAQDGAPAPGEPVIGISSTSSRERVEYHYATCTGRTVMTTPYGARAALTRTEDPLDPMEPRDVLITLCLTAFGVSTKAQRALIAPLGCGYAPQDASRVAMALLMLATTREEARELAECARIMWHGEADLRSWQHIAGLREQLPLEVELAHRSEGSPIVLYYPAGRGRAHHAPQVQSAWGDILRACAASAPGDLTSLALARELYTRPEDAERAAALDDWGDDLQVDADGQLRPTWRERASALRLIVRAVAP